MISLPDLLSRLRLHVSAAYVRKNAGSMDLRSTTKVDTTMYTACGRCRKPLMKAIPTSSSPVLPNGPNSLGPSGSTGIAHRRNPSTGRPGFSFSRSRSRAPSNPLKIPADSLLQDLGGEVAEGAYSFCSACKRSTARCALW